MKKYLMNSLGHTTEVIDEPLTAYELADELAFKLIAGDESGAFNSKLIVMLRQQADRIAELEKECLDWEKAFIKTIQESHVIK